MTSTAGRRHIIKRPRLTRLLDETTARIILLVAPAGYGKTTLAREWLEDKIHGWYRATAASADPAMLAIGLANALAAACGDLAPRIQQRVGAEGSRPPETADLASLLNEALLSAPSAPWLSLDDYHCLLGSPDSERLIELIDPAAVRLLITSRVRPGWATARRILYGEIAEIGSSALAITHDEASSILGDRPSPEVAGLVALARGWPAVIGLAVHSGSAPTSEDVPETLYEFFAEELYLRASDHLKQALPFFAVVARLEIDSLRALTDADAPAIIEEATSCGIVASVDDGVYEVHPLFREFLLRRVSQEHPDLLEAALATSLDYLLHTRAWDEAFAILERRPSVSGAEALLAAAWEDLLAFGRHETLERWLKTVRGLGPSPLLDFISAEVAFRRGEYERAKIRGLAAARGLPATDPRRAKAWLRAGYAADFLDDYELSLECFGEAHESALTHADVTEAMRGRASVAIAAGHPSARQFWHDYNTIDCRTGEEALRKATARMVAASYFGEVDQALRETAGTESLLEDVDDPMARASFLHNRAYDLVLAGRYAEARDSLQHQVEKHRRFGLSFAIPHALINLARAEIGLREFSTARRDALQAMTHLDDQTDIHVAMNAEIIAMLLVLESEGGHASYQGPLERFPRSSTLGEIYAVRGLLRACAGDFRASKADMAASAEIAQGAEAAVFRAWLAAIVAIETSNKTKSAVNEAVALTEQTGIRDPFVAAYRGYPSLIPIVLEISPERSLFIEAILRQARDTRLARQHGLVAPGPTDGLSERELDVLDLLSQGLSNDEISTRLVIAQSTVKVHVRHIFEKLGVRSRTAAAKYYLQR